MKTKTILAILLISSFLSATEIGDKLKAMTQQVKTEIKDGSAKIKKKLHTIPRNPNKLNKNAQKEGKWTVLLTSGFNHTFDKKRAKYYRIAEYKDGLPQGIIKDYFLDGTLQFEGILLSEFPSVYDGEIRIYYQDGTLKKLRTYKDKKLDGKQQFFSKTGVKQSHKTFIDGKEVGESRLYYVNPHILQSLVQYKDGKKHGTSTSYFQNGELESEEMFEEGKPIGISKTYYESPNSTESLSPYENGLKHGKHCTFYPNGDLKSEKMYRLGKEHGICSYYYENPHILERTFNYVEGMRQGEHYTYFPNGDVEFTGKFVNDKESGIWKLNFYDEDFRYKYFQDGKEISPLNLSKLGVFEYLLRLFKSENTSVVTSIKTNEWNLEIYLPLLIQQLDSEIKIKSVVFIEQTSVDEKEFTTLGFEIQYLLEGYLQGVYPPDIEHSEFRSNPDKYLKMLDRFNRKTKQ